MLKSMRFALLIGSLCFASQPLAATDLTLLRGGVGITGAPVTLSGKLDVNGNGRQELLVADRSHVSLVEEDANPRGYREVTRMEGPSNEEFTSALLVDVPGVAPALLLKWGDQLELRDAATSRIKAAVRLQIASMALGDVDGDGFPEIVAIADQTLVFLDPTTLESRGSIPLPEAPNQTGSIAVADIVGDSPAEIVLERGKAYTVTRVGSTMSLAEVWNAGLPGPMLVRAIDLEGQVAIALTDTNSWETWLATFAPKPSLRLVPIDGLNPTPLFADANGDGRVDALYRDTDEILRAVDIVSGALLWELNTSLAPFDIGSIVSPTAVDLDGDGASEIAWADGRSDSGVVAMSMPPFEAPRWHSDGMQSHVIDWTTVKRPNGSSSFAYLTSATDTVPHLGSLGFLNSVTLTDEGGSPLAWLPGYNETWPARFRQRAIAALPLDGYPDAVVIAGEERPSSEDVPLKRLLWTFDGSGALLSSRTFVSSADPQRIALWPVLDRAERQLVVAGALPRGAVGTSVESMCVEIVDYATGALLWQSMPLPTFRGARVRKLEIADLDGDGKLEVVVSYGADVTVLTPEAGTGVVMNHTAHTFSLLSRGAGRKAKLATLDNTLIINSKVAVYDGLAMEPEKTFELSGLPFPWAIALFAQAPDDALMFATGRSGIITVQRYTDGEIVATSDHGIGDFNSIAAMDLDGDHRIDIIGSGSGLQIWRLDNDYIFRAGFD